VIVVNNCCIPFLNCYINLNRNHPISANLYVFLTRYQPENNHLEGIIVCGGSHMRDVLEGYFVAAYMGMSWGRQYVTRCKGHHPGEQQGKAYFFTCYWKAGKRDRNCAFRLFVILACLSPAASLRKNGKSIFTWPCQANVHASRLRWSTCPHARHRYTHIQINAPIRPIDLDG